MDMVKFTFQPRWKEELVCTCHLGSFILEMPMGILSVYLPTQVIWQEKAPPWAKDHWVSVHEQLTEWCAQGKIPLYVDGTANVY